MNKLAAIKYFFMTMVLLYNSCVAREATSCSEILEYAQNHLPHFGTLKSSNGFVYVDVDDDYIHKLVPYIQKDGFREPPYFGTSGLVGAHITVVYPDEMQKEGMSNIEECGETIHFTLNGCKVVHPPKSQEFDEVYFIEVEVPELNRIREQYGLPKREYDFHITIGVKPKIATYA